VVKRMILICSVFVFQTWAQGPADNENSVASGDKTAEATETGKETDKQGAGAVTVNKDVKPISAPKERMMEEEAELQATQSEKTEETKGEVKKTEEKEAEDTTADEKRVYKNKEEKKKEEKKSKSAKRTEKKYEPVIPPVDNTDVATAVEIPSGVLFGKFTKEDGPFLLKGSVIVPSGQTLEFGPGSKIYIGGKYSTITVFGKIIAKGTPAEPVIFQSAKKNPNPWDWDRIYCRSRQRSGFEYCVIRHSNYGIYVENGSAEIKNCTFARNSLHGLVVKNSDVFLSTSLFARGHVCAIFCEAGANVTADSVTVKNNITGIACAAKSYFKLERGVIKGNNNGLAVRGGASVNIIAADITRNKNGLLTENMITRKLREMVYNNTLDMKIVTPAEMEKILKPPEEVKSIVLPTGKTDIQVSSTFKPGFSALKAPREQMASFIGNVSLGFKYFDAKSHYHPSDMDTSTVIDTTISGSDTTIVSDTTISRARYYQTKYPGEFSWPVQPELVIFAQGKRGELDVNFNTDMNLNDWYNNKVKANLFTLSMNYADQHVVLGDFYENISETSISGRKIRGVKYYGDFWSMGRGTKRMEFRLAAGETEKKKDVGDNEDDIFGDEVDTGSSVRQQLTYVAHLGLKPSHNVTISARGLISHDQDANPIFTDELTDTAAPDPISASTGSIDANVILLDGRMEVNAEIDLGSHDTVDTNDWDKIAWYKPQVIPSLKRVFGLMQSQSDFTDHFAGLVSVDGAVSDRLNLSGSFMEIRENYFSAGNPYLEPDRRVATLEGDNQFSDAFTTDFGYEFEQTSVSYTLKTDNESPTFNNTFDVGVKYSFGENKPGLNADYEMKLQTKDDQGEIYYLDASNDTLSETVTYKFREMDHTAGVEVKQRFENGMDYSVKYYMRRKNDFTEYKDTEIDDKEDSWENAIQARFGVRFKRRIRNKITVKVKYKTEIEDDMKRYDIKVIDNFRLNIIPRKLSLLLKGEYRKQNETDADHPGKGLDLYQQTVEAELKYTITSRLSATIMGKYEDYYDETESSTENYTVRIAGMYLTYLF